MDKYGTPKYRLVVRITNTDVIAQIIYAKIKGDIVLSSAYSHELPNYGIKHGLTNYSAAYATGLLVARRILTHLKLADKYVGQTKPDGSIFLVEPIDDGPHPFYVLLDVGLTRTSTGNRVFAAMKGAADGGLDIPHSERRLAGYLHDKQDSKNSKFDPAILRKYIFGGHVTSHMERLQKEDPDAYKKQFSRYIADGVAPSSLEEIYKKAHAAIRSDPIHKKKEAKKEVKPRRFNLKKITLEERKKRVAEKLAARAK